MKNESAIMNIEPTPTFWDEVKRTIYDCIRSGTLDDKVAHEYEVYACAVRTAWSNLVLNKYHSKERFNSIDEFINAARHDKSIVSILPGDFPGEYFIQSRHNVWSIKPISNHTGTMSLIDVSIKGSNARWFGTFSECVLESLDIMKEIDDLLPQFQDLIARTRMEVTRDDTIRDIENTTSNAESLPYDLRRTVQDGRFTYLVDDSHGTAWISQGNTVREPAYTIPERVVLEGKEFSITSVAIGAYDNCPDLEELTVPDRIEYLDEDSFKGCPKLRRVHIGKGMRHYFKWTFSGCPVKGITIDPGNPYIKVSDDGNMVLSKDGQRLLYTIRDVHTLNVPEGVTELGECAISCLDNLEEIHLPSTLRIIGSNGIYHNRHLKRIILPPSVCELGTQALSENESMSTVDFSEGIHEIDEEVLMMDSGIRTLILRSNTPITIKGVHSRYEYLPKCKFPDLNPEDCKLLVPKDLVDTYKNHPLWSSFKEIVPISEKE